MPTPNYSNYQPKVRRHIEVCEHNFELFAMLVGGTAPTSIPDEKQFAMAPKLTAMLKLRQQSRYTCELDLVVQCANVPKAQDPWFNLHFSVRCYFDAKLLEVINYQGNNKLLPKYDYPNEKMHMPDEKRQANLLLGHFLALLVQAHQSNIPFSADCN